ncbi:MAG: hypothetical protein K2Y18_04410 [Alphaproteobacteria bacterium]|jgi:hypothetical protein|nr:hypothetical protein [Alphaproteobacteria bacterium]
MNSKLKVSSHKKSIQLIVLSLFTSICLSSIPCYSADGTDFQNENPENPRKRAPSHEQDPNLNPKKHSPDVNGRLEISLYSNGSESGHKQGEVTQANSLQIPCNFGWEDKPNLREPNSGYSRKIVRYLRGEGANKIFMDGEEYAPEIKLVGDRVFNHSAEHVGWKEDNYNHFSYERVNIFVMDGANKVVRFPNQELEVGFPHQLQNMFVPVGEPVFNREQNSFSQEFIPTVVYTGKSQMKHAEPQKSIVLPLKAVHLRFKADEELQYVYHVVKLVSDVAEYLKPEYELLVPNYVLEERIIGWVNNDQGKKYTPKKRRYFENDTGLFSTVKRKLEPFGDVFDGDVGDYGSRVVKKQIPLLRAEVTEFTRGDGSKFEEKTSFGIL